MHFKFLRLAALVVAVLSPATAQVALLHIQILEGEGAVHPPGSRIARPLTVEVTDETGRPVDGAAVSFHLPDDGPTGVFLNGLRTEVSTTDAQGRAGVRGLVLNRVPGRFQVRVFASKEQARAGVISFQYIAEPRSGAAAASFSASSSAGPQRVARGRARWLIVAAVVAGGAAAGIASAGRANGTAATPPPTPAPPVLTIGAPSTTVGKP